MKILTVCQGGHVRSVALKYLLHYGGYGQHDVIACGWQSNTQETREMLYEWADLIIVMQPEFAQFVPEKFHTKWKPNDIGTSNWKEGDTVRRLYCFDVGQDRYGNAFHPELQAMLRSMIDRSKLFPKFQDPCATSPSPNPV